MRLLSSLTPDDLEVVRTYVNLCVLKQFSFVPVYHPLALKALGNSLKEVNALDPLEWARKQEIPDKLADDDLTKIYEIIDGLNNTLHDADKLLFMDVAVFAPPEGLFDLNFLLRWLGGVHDTNERDIRRRLRRFETLSLLEIQEPATFQMHDFYIDFAHYKLQTVSDIIQERYVFKEGGDPLPHGLHGTPSGGCRERLVRVRLQVSPHNSEPDEGIHISEESLRYRFPGMKLGEWANLIVLHLESGGEDIDIGALRCLRALHLEADHNLRTFTCSNPLEQLRFVNFKCWNGQVKDVPSFTSNRLQILDLNLDIFSLRRPVTLPPASTALTVLRLARWYSGLEIHELDFAPFSNLIELVIESEFNLNGHWKLYLSGLGALTRLKKLVLQRLPIVGPLLGLERLTNLEKLVLRSSCSKNVSLPELDCSPNLRHLYVSGTDIQELKGLKKLLKLQELYCIGCVHLRNLPDLSGLPKLYSVNVQGCTLLENVTAPDCCGYVPPKQNLPRYSLALMNSEALVKSLDAPWAALTQRAVLNQLAKDPSLSETDVENFQKDSEEILERLRNLVQQNLDHGEKVMRHPVIQARLTANGKRAERESAASLRPLEDEGESTSHHCPHSRKFFCCIAIKNSCVTFVCLFIILGWIQLLEMESHHCNYSWAGARTLCEVITGDCKTEESSILKKSGRNVTDCLKFRNTSKHFLECKA